MITDAFDRQSPAIINPPVNPDAMPVDACILTFSHEIEKFVLSHYDCKQAGCLWSATGGTPIYSIADQGKTFAFL